MGAICTPLRVGHKSLEVVCIKAALHLSVRLASKVQILYQGLFVLLRVLAVQERFQLSDDERVILGLR